MNALRVCHPDRDPSTEFTLAANAHADALEQQAANARAMLELQRRSPHARRAPTTMSREPEAERPTLLPGPPASHCSASPPMRMDVAGHGRTSILPDGTPAVLPLQEAAYTRL